jgi:hypothetical protein
MDVTKILICIAGLVVGLVLGAVFGGALIGGSAAGIGVATGLSAGICQTVIAADEEGLLTSEEIDRVLTRAASDAAELSGTEPSEPVVGILDDCGQVMERMRSAAAE